MLRVRPRSHPVGLPYSTTTAARRRQGQRNTARRPTSAYCQRGSTGPSYLTSASSRPRPARRLTSHRTARKPLHAAGRPRVPRNGTLHLAQRVAPLAPGVLAVFARHRRAPLVWPSSVPRRQPQDRGISTSRPDRRGHSRHLEPCQPRSSPSKGSRGTPETTLRATGQPRSAGRPRHHHRGFARNGLAHPARLPNGGRDNPWSCSRTIQFSNCGPLPVAIPPASDWSHRRQVWVTPI